jgi:hypothetical protein
MIIISAGMPRSGTGWIYNLTNDLLAAAGHMPAGRVRKRFLLQWALRPHNNSVGQPNALKLAGLTVPYLLGQKFAVKTHAGPAPSLKTWVKLGLARVHYSYRDPRDVVVSAWDEGERMRGRGKTSSFAAYKTKEEMIDAVAGWLRGWDKWMAYEPALKLRYEDLKADTVGQMKRICAHYDLNLSESQFAPVIEKYAPGNKQVGAHFYKGITGRFREDLTEAQIALCHERFGDYIAKMGYGDV